MWLVFRNGLTLSIQTASPMLSASMDFPDSQLAPEEDSRALRASQPTPQEPL